MWKKSPRSEREKLISFLWKCDLISCARNFHIFVHCVFHVEHVPYTYVLTTNMLFPQIVDPKNYEIAIFLSNSKHSRRLTPQLCVHVTNEIIITYLRDLGMVRMRNHVHTPIPQRNIIIKHITITFEYWKIMQSKTR